MTGWTFDLPARSETVSERAVALVCQQLKTSESGRTLAENIIAAPEQRMSLSPDDRSLLAIAAGLALESLRDPRDQAIRDELQRLRYALRE